MKDRGELIQSTDDKTRQSVRNLRIREDTVKYMRNLRTDTFYDPKSRSMRENPFPDQDPTQVLSYLQYSPVQITISFTCCGVS